MKSQRRTELINSLNNLQESILNTNTPVALAEFADLDYDRFDKIIKYRRLNLGITILIYQKDLQITFTLPLQFMKFVKNQFRLEILDLPQVNLDLYGSEEEKKEEEKKEEKKEEKREEEIRVSSDLLEAYLIKREEILQYVVKKIQEHDITRISIGGAKFGGSMANIFALDISEVIKTKFEYKHIDIDLVTYGALRAGNQAFATAVNSAVNGVNMRIRFKEDKMSQIPDNSYIHAGSEVRINEDNSLIGKSYKIEGDPTPRFSEERYEIRVFVNEVKSNTPSNSEIARINEYFSFEDFYITYEQILNSIILI
eukprot:CAMPEP_0170522908 /NCGR_PEP_ID=MMETSP0209-20121228/8298_1 /TAXON_ID=665100 ORGANISM="Litonotus pictus, Strain P1" /NCGR_SAMPLE_ID=MMETSP0209 /ASSEMBLY_ACC=CAM_ASM_000301 /LENGTH=311 /DNA_ID=CAMNT_0010810633 /DNA_START=139 /DNA_END=1074 /DNA_ORIENTATION=+